MTLRLRLCSCQDNTAIIVFLCGLPIVIHCGMSLANFRFHRFGLVGGVKLTDPMLVCWPYGAVLTPLAALPSSRLLVMSRHIVTALVHANSRAAQSLPLTLQRYALCIHLRRWSLKLATCFR
jgi:hypothetical protein